MLGKDETSVYLIDKQRVDDRSPVLTKSSSFHFRLLPFFVFFFCIKKQLSSVHTSRN